MKMISILFACIFFLIFKAYSQAQEATTVDGKTVVLHSDSTWHFKQMLQDTLTIQQGILLEGCWFYPDDAFTNIAFYSDYTFKFNSFDGLKKGDYNITVNNVYLVCSDGTKYEFLVEDKQYLKSYPLEQKKYYLVHSESWTHPNLK